MLTALPQPVLGRLAAILGRLNRAVDALPLGRFGAPLTTFAVRVWMDRLGTRIAQLLMRIEAGLGAPPRRPASPRPRPASTAIDHLAGLEEPGDLDRLEDPADFAGEISFGKGIITDAEGYPAHLYRFLPRSRGWLAAALADPDPFTATIQELLHDPALQPLLEHDPASFGRLFRPLCRALGIHPPAALRPGIRPPPAIPAPEPVATPKPAPQAWPDRFAAALAAREESRGRPSAIATWLLNDPLSVEKTA